MADLSAAPSPPRAPAPHSPEGDTAAPARAPPQRWGTEPSGGMRARARTGPARGGNALGRLCAAPRPSPPLPGPRAAPGDGGRASAGGGRRAAEPSGRGGERGSASSAWAGPLGGPGAAGLGSVRDGAGREVSSLPRAARRRPGAEPRARPCPSRRERLRPDRGVPSAELSGS